MVRPDELRAWWRAANAAPDGDKFQFTMLTGLRPGEVSGLKVADVDLARGRVDLVDTKNGKPHAVLLSVQA